MADEPNNNQAQDFDADSYQATQSLIVNLDNQLEELNDVLKEHRQMLKNVFENDAQYQEAEDIADEAKSALKQRKQQIEETEEVIQLKTKIKDLKQDRKDIKESLNNHLLSYFQMSGGSTTITMPDGEDKELVLKAKLK